MPWCPQCGVEYREGFERCSDCGSVLVAEPPAREEEARPGPEWVAVADYATDEEARIVQGLLVEQGIRAAVVNRQMVLYPAPQADTADVLVVVPPEDADRADEALARAEAGEDALLDSDVPAEGEPTES